MISDMLAGGCVLNLLTGTKGRCWVEHEIQIQGARKEKERRSVCKKEAKDGREQKAHLSFLYDATAKFGNLLSYLHLV